MKLFEENHHKVIGKARSQKVRDSQDRAQKICTAQDFYNICNDPHASLLQTKEALFKQAIYLNLDHLSSHHLPRNKGNLINQK